MRSSGDLKVKTGPVVVSWLGRTFGVAALPVVMLISASVTCQAHGLAAPRSSIIDNPDALDESVIEGLSSKAQNLQEAGDLKSAARIYEDILVWSEKTKGYEHPDTGIILFRLGSLYADQEEYAKAEQLLMRELAISEKIAGSIHPDTAATLFRLGVLYADKQEPGKAEPLLVRALAIYEKEVGPEHADTGAVLFRLGSLYADQGEYAKAEPLLMRELAISEKIAGSIHPDTAATLFRLGVLYADKQEPGKAEPLLVRALAIYEKEVGPEHADTGAVLFRLGSLYADQGEYAKAEPLLMRELAISEKTAESNHLDTATSLLKLGSLYADHNQAAKAEPVLLRALAIYEKEAGLVHADAGEALFRLGTLFQDAGNHAKAEPLLEKALAIYENVAGFNHDQTAASLYRLGLLYQSIGKYEKAEPLLVRELKISIRVLGSDHPDTAISLSNLAGLYRAQGLYSRAESLHQRALSIRKKALGSDHPDTAQSLNGLAVLYQEQGLYSKAEPLYQHAINIIDKALGPEHRDTATILNNLAALYETQGLYSKAEPLYQRAVAISEKAQGPEHPDTAISLNNLAVLYQRQDLYSKAEPLNQKALTIREKLLGLEHPDIAQSLNNLAALYVDQGLYSKAEPLGERALAINEKTLGPEHQATATSLNTLGLLYRTQGLVTKAEPLYQRALAINKKALGLDHPNTASSLISLAELYDNQGLYAKAETLTRHGLTVEFTLIQREAPYIPVAERQNFLNSFGNAYEASFSAAQRGSSGANLALFSRLNRQGLLQEIEQSQAQLASLPGPQQAIANELRVVTQQLASMALTPEQRRQLKGRQEELEKQLYRLLPQLQPRVVEVQQVAAALPAGSALIEFQRYDPHDGRKPPDQRWGEARYLVLVLKPDGAITPIDLGPAQPIDASIQAALAASEQKQADALELWAQVGRSVLDPLAGSTRGVNSLFLSPDGELNRVPFAALPAPGSSQLLSEALQLRLLTTGRELLDLQNAPNTKASPALVVANPAFDRTPGSLRAPVQLASAASQQRSADFGSQRWAPLPGTATEGAAIAQLTGGRLLAGEQARAAAIQQQQSPRLLHLATHAYFQPDLPEAERNNGQQRSNSTREGPAALSGENPLLRSGIALAGANQPDADPADDGYLTALEVARLNWKGTELVVISACESGKGYIQAGEGVYGLKRAIAVAGARSSLLSLWKVDDRATAAFMQNFYRKLQAGMGRADALAATQKEFRQSSNPSWRHPFVWAAFQLSGDWGPVRW